MLRSLFSGVSGLKVHQVRLDVVSNNIANVNTNGFKASRVRFDDVLSQTIEIATAPLAGRGGQNPKQIGLGALGTTITRDMSQGSVEITNRTTDLAIQGGGMFVLRDGENIGDWYTRDGNFTLDANGNLVAASSGYRVQGWNSTLDALSGTFTINSSNPVEDMTINLAQQMAPVATNAIALGGNLDQRLETAIDPIRVGWTKNGVSRTVEMRFTHVHPTRNLYLWRLYDPSTIDPATGDATRIATDTDGINAEGIIELNDEGQVIRHYLNFVDDDGVAAQDTVSNLDTVTGNELPNNTNAANYLSLTTDVWASQIATKTFNGYDFVTLTTENDGDSVSLRSNERAASQTVATATPTITVDWTTAPFSMIANAATFPAGWGNDADLNAALGAQNVAARVGIPGNGLGVPVQYIDQVTSEVVTKRIDIVVGADTHTVAQLANDNIVSTVRNNPNAIGIMGQPGTDLDSLQIFIDGTQYSRVAAFGAFPSNEFRLDADAGIIEINRQIPAGTSIIASYGTDLRANSLYTVTAGTDFSVAFGALAAGVAAGGIATATDGANATVNRTVAAGGAADAQGDSSPFYKAGSASTMRLTRGAVSEDWTEIPYTAPVAGAPAPGPNQFMINPTNGDVTMGNWSVASGLGAVINTDDVTSFTFRAYRLTRDNQEGGTVITGFDTDGDTVADDNRFGRSDLWRVRRLPASGADSATVELYLQGDFDSTVAGSEAPDADTIGFVPTFNTSTTARRIEMNYESDDRVNIIIPNGLTKRANVNPAVDLTAESFNITPNTTQVTGVAAGNNNQATSGDAVPVTVNEPDNYRYATAIEVFDSLGRSWNVPIRFERIDTNRWMMYAIDPTDTTGTRIAGFRVLTFEADGDFDQVNSQPFEAPTANGTANDGALGIYFDPSQAGGAPLPPEGSNPVMITPTFTNLKQTARLSDAVVETQNGVPPGRLETFSFNDEGFVVGLFDNGRSLNLGRVALQVFVNPSGLISVGGNMYKNTVNAGKLGSPQRPGFDGAGSIVPGALEGSNVDLSVEFVDLIITQRGFQAQSRSISTADQVLQEVLGLKR